MAKWCSILKWLSPYTRRVVRTLLKKGKTEHRGYRYHIIIDDDTNLIVILDRKAKKKHVLLKGN